MITVFEILEITLTAIGVSLAAAVTLTFLTARSFKS